MLEKVLNDLRWLGHDGFLLKGCGKTVYIDPFRIPQGLPPADIICISHEHFDHCSPEDVEKIRQDSTVIVTEPGAAAKLAGRVRTLAPGESCVVDGVSIEAVAAYNTNKEFHPLAKQWLGFVITLDGVRIYHAGDTDHIQEMAGIRADIAMLPVSGTYVMTAEEAVQAALSIRPQVAIPMHFAAIVGTDGDAERFAAGLAGQVRVEILARR
jgi:L-ascorbate metabolism protein UlaG (beta-lactamase superfamily)